MPEVGSCIRPSSDGTFEYFLAYGAYDERAEGIWRLEQGEVIVTTAGSGKAYVFAFDPGDLGRERFASVPLRINDDALEMTYADMPISDLQGRQFRYIRALMSI